MRYLHFKYIFTFIATCVWMTALGQHGLSTSETSVLEDSCSEYLNLDRSYQVGTVEADFSVLQTGAAVYSIPIETLEGLPSATPRISLVYNSQQGNGICGLGFSISGLSSITRSLKDIYHDGKAGGITRTFDDAFCLNGQRLMPVQQVAGCDSAVFYVESDPYTRVILHGRNAVSPYGTGFDVYSSDGMKYQYNARHIYYNSSGQQRINGWHLSKAESPVGNIVFYNYTVEGSGLCPSAIYYGVLSTYWIKFEYENRPDTVWLQTDDVKTPMTKRLKSIVSGISVGGSEQTYRRYTISYANSDGSQTKASRVIDITVSNGGGSSLRPTRFAWNELPFYSCSRSTPALNPSLYTYGAVEGEMSFFSADLNGDGLSDLIQTGVTHGPTGTQDCTFIRAYYSSLNASGNICLDEGYYLPLAPNVHIKGLWEDSYSSPMAVDADGDGECELHVPIFFNSADSRYFGFEIFKNGIDCNGVKYTDMHTSSFDDILWNTADFNNDGKAESVIVEKVKEGTNSYYGAIIGGFPGVDEFCQLMRFSLPHKPLHIFPADMNGDGMTDVVVFYQYGYSVFWNDGSWLDSAYSQQQTTIIPLTSTFTLTMNPFKVWPGDFDGDGCTDFLIAQPNDGNLYFGIGKYNGSLECSVAATTDVWEQSETPKDNKLFTCIVIDMDGDGKSDVILNKGMFKAYGGTIFEHTYYLHDKTYTYWFFSDGRKLNRHTMSLSTRKKDALPQYYVAGDFNGDGMAELASFSYDCYSGNYANADPALRIYHNRDYQAGSGKIETIINGLNQSTDIAYSSLTADSIYTKGTGSSFPVVDVTLPLHAVSSISAGNGAAGTARTRYSYEGLKVHVQGLGLMGMTATSVTDINTGMSTENRITARHAVTFQPINTQQTQTLGGLSATRTEECTLVQHASTGAYVLSIREIESTDFDGNSIVEYYGHSPAMNDMVMSHYTWFNDDRSKAVFYEYGFHGGTYRPVRIYDQASVGSEPMHVNITSYTYDSHGQVTSKTEHDGTPLALRTAYRYNFYGRVLSDTVSGNGVTTAVTVYSYDSMSSHIDSKLVYGYARTEYTYDTWGNMLTQSDLTRSVYPQVTTYAYDAWGRLASCVSPEGLTTSYSRGWGTSAAKCYYVLEERTGQPWVKTWYDETGREVLMESIGMKGTSVSSAISYNDKGQVVVKCYRSGNKENISYYTYDSRGRLLTDDTSGMASKCYSYNGRTVTTAFNDRIYTKTCDSWGNITQSTDPVASVSYGYASCGKPNTVTSNGSTVTMEYDNAANQTRLTDPDAGTMTYAYDALGRIASQTDGRGVTTVNTYNTRGQLATTAIGNKTVVYNYGQTSNDNGLLVSVSRDGYTASYQYDAYNRVISETRYFKNANKTLTMSYAYNSQGLLSSRTFPGGLQVSYEYDNYGYLERMYAANRLLYEQQAYTGDTSVVRLGQNQTFYDIFDSQGRRTFAFAYAGDFEDQDYHAIQEYAYSPSTGNLDWRQVGDEHNVQYFSYDNFDRIVSVEDYYGATEEFSYAANGNLISKSGLTFTYGGPRPHAITSVASVMGGPNLSQQNTSMQYNELGKLSKIVKDDGTVLTYSYGTDGQRWESSSGLYFGDYEERIIEGNMKRFIYLDGGVLCIQDGQQTDFYFIYTDHQGSVIEITDDNGDIVFEATYDAWGNQTVYHNDIGFHRGYTGHEMMPEFGLINMNGRVYDPLLGRFLSPDNFVQQPDNSQNFNRYSYCLNNPLKYTDPDGEWIHIVIGAVVGGVVNVISNWSNIDGFWQGLTSFISGAGAGAAVAATGGMAGAGMESVLVVSAATGAGTAATNSIVAQTGKNFEGIDKVDWGIVGKDAFIGSISNVAGSAAGYVATNASFLVNNINSPVLRSAVVSPLASGTGHIAGGTLYGLMKGESLSSALHNSFEGIEKSLALGGASGVVSTTGLCYANNVSPWNGAPLKADISFGRNNNQEHHTFRHTDKLQLSREKVRLAVLEDFQHIGDMHTGQLVNRIIIVDGIKLQYTVFRLFDGSYNVGRIHEKM